MVHSGHKKQTDFCDEKKCGICKTSIYRRTVVGLQFLCFHEMLPRHSFLGFGALLPPWFSARLAHPQGCHRKALGSTPPFSLGAVVLRVLLSPSCTLSGGTGQILRALSVHSCASRNAVFKDQLYALEQQLESLLISLIATPPRPKKAVLSPSCQVKIPEGAVPEAW